MGADELRGCEGLLGPVKVVTGSHVVWAWPSCGVRYITPLLNPVGPYGSNDVAAISAPVSGIIAGASTAASTSPFMAAVESASLPPPPQPEVPTQRDVGYRTATPASELVDDQPASLIAFRSRFLSAAELAEMQVRVQERMALYDVPYDKAKLDALCQRFALWCMERRLPRPLRIMLGQCLWRRWAGDESLE